MSEQETETYWMQYNPHPKQKLVDDCVKRAICCTTGMEYMEVQRMLNRIKNQIGAQSFGNKIVGVELAKRSGWEHIVFSEDGKYDAMDGVTFCKQHPTGNYILQMPGHWVGCVDGKLYDTWDSTVKGVSEAWKVTGISEQPK